MILILFLQLLSATWASEECVMRCSNVVNRVCGMSTAWDGTRVLSRHHNICHLNKVKCHLRTIARVEQVPDLKCLSKERRMNMKTRRLQDFGIVGAHQACNHTCPTYCVDTYEPVCAQIWTGAKKKFVFRPMVNHCHVDLFSCSVGVNVTITPLARCFLNPTALLFMNEIAAMKSLGLLDARRSLNKLNMEGYRSRTEDMELDNTKWETERILRRLMKSIILKRLAKF